MKSVIIYLLTFALSVYAMSVFAQDSGIDTTYGKKLIEFAFDPVTLLSDTASTGFDYSKPTDDWILYREYKKLQQYQDDPVWSPDGNWIACTEMLRDPSGVWVVPASGGEPVPLYCEYIEYEGYYLTTGYIGICGFTPDSREVVFVKELIDEDRGTTVNLSITDSSMGWSMKDLIPVLMAVNIETGEARTLVEEARNGLFSHNGKYFAYTDNDHRKVTDPENAEHYGHIALYDTESGETRYVTDYSTGEFWFGPDDSYIVASNSTKSYLLKIPLDGSGHTRLYPSVTFPAPPYPSPDGRWVLYVELESNRLYVYDSETGETYQVFPDIDGSIGNPVWSPDGTKIAFTLRYEEKIEGEDDYRDVKHIFVSDFNPDDFMSPTGINAQIPKNIVLCSNYPNPFNPATTIEFSLPQSGFTELVIYNTTGQKVREFVSGSIPAGYHSVVWDGTDENGIAVSSGNYLYYIKTAGGIYSSKMMLMK
ncbi:MAG: PD40 domain-containing protein [Candidatus Latescibacteria bacterium]|nr:PD40 domain-containing protein [Candidatus Latescibacterota bacterium]